MTWRTTGIDIYGRPTFGISFHRSTAWGVVQELNERWAWELNMPDPRDDQRGRAETRAEAQERVITAARQRGLIDLEREHDLRERVAIETEDAAQLAVLGGHHE